ncbi:MAG: hypothetical protein KGV44_04690 [Flavobacteriaceae bacterium]|nr:hypothetical protein [Flavobacteriaceae bacterium]
MKFIKELIYRYCYRLQHSMAYCFGGGFILLFFEKSRTLGITGIVVGFFGYFIFGWLAEKTTPKEYYDADENGNAKPNYR